MTTTYSAMALDLIEKHIDNEGEAFAIFHLLKTKFDWAGTVFCADDIRQQVANNRDVEFDSLAEHDPDVEKIVDYVIGDRYWRSGLEDWMTEQGWDCVYDAVRQAEVELGLEQS